MKTYILAIYIIFGCFITAQAQTKAKQKAKYKTTNQTNTKNSSPAKVKKIEDVSSGLPKEKEDKPFTFVDIMPEFPGGEKALLNFLSKHIKYPLYAVENKIEGTVIIEFIVKTDGSISNAEVLQDVKGGCSEEALRVVNSMPKWKPGMQNGIPVAVYFTIPIEFELPKEKEEPITWADEMPVFPGGEQALIHYLKENLIYPQVAKEKKIEGTVVVEFRIKSTGEVSGVKVLESIGSGCDEEGIRLVENMPKWKPGKQNGKPIAVYFTLPIEFKLP